MLHHFKNVAFILLAFIILSGCAGPKLTVVDTTGAPSPHPVYTSQTTSGSQMAFTWFYAQYQGVYDLDESAQLYPVYLDRKMSHNFSSKKTHRAHMVMKIYNPQESSYTVFTNKTIKYKNGGKVTYHNVAGKSFMTYREWDFQFPLRDGIEKMSFYIEIHKGTDIVLRTRKFTYSIN